VYSASGTRQILFGFLSELLAGANHKFSFKVSNMDDTKPICRICFEQGSVEEPLYQPCSCSGTIRHVHATCLETWQKTSVGGNKETCEICGTTFSYKQGADDLDWAAVCGKIVNGVIEFVAWFVVPYTSASLLAIITAPIEASRVGLRISWSVWLMGLINIIALGVPVVLVCAITDLKFTIAGTVPSPSKSVYVRHLKRLAGFLYKAMVLVTMLLLALLTTRGAGWVLGCAGGRMHPSSVDVYQQLASALQNSFIVRWASASLFAGLNATELERAALCLSDMILSYYICMLFILHVVLMVKMAAFLLRLITRQVSIEVGAVFKRCLQCAPLAALWYSTLILQETTNINQLLVDCVGIDLPLARWLFPLCIALAPGRILKHAVAGLDGLAGTRCREFWADYRNVRHSYFQVCRNVLAGSLIVAPLYLAMVHIPLRYGHYLCPLASTAVHAVGGSAQVVPQLPSLALVFSGMLYVPGIFRFLLNALICSVRIEEWLQEREFAADTPSTSAWLSVAVRGIAALVLWMALLTVVLSWLMHASYNPGRWALAAPPPTQRSAARVCSSPPGRPSMRFGCGHAVPGCACDPGDGGRVGRCPTLPVE
jgi:hypothetical protein